MVEETSTVVVCMDGSEHSDCALDYYTKKLHKPDNKIVILFNSEFTGLSFGVMPVAPSNASVVVSMLHKEEERIKTVMGHLKSQAEKLKIDAEIIRVHGDVEHSLLEKCEELGASLIVVGSRGLGQIRRTFLGSISDYLVHHASVPVLVCKHGPNQHTEGH